MEGAITMRDSDTFEGLKQSFVEENERRYGAEARERYGAAAVEESNRRMLGMSEHDYEAWRGLEEEIRVALEAAVHGGTDPAGTEGARICDLHRRWLSYTWPAYSAEAHRGPCRNLRGRCALHGLLRPRCPRLRRLAARRHPRARPLAASAADK